jgi:signal transduction histidine kinase
MQAGLRIRSYLALAAIALLVPVVIFAAAALDMLRDAERQAALRGVRESGRASALVVDRELAAAHAALRALATSRHLADGTLDGFYEQAKASGTDADKWIVLFDSDGRQLINTRVPFGTPLPTRRNPEIGHRVLRDGKPHVSNLIRGVVADRHVISVEIPVMLKDGRRYVLAQAFIAEYFGAALRRPNIPASWVIGIHDRDGITIVRNQGSERFVASPAVPALVQAAARADEGMVRTASREGIDMQGVFTHSALSGWTVSVGVPAADIESTARHAVIVASIGLLAALACAGAVAVLLGRRLSRSIERAARATAALGRGERPPPSRSTVVEVDALHQALADAGALLEQERESRRQAEAERARLFASEQEARKLAESQNRAKDEFLAMLGHELRNPLNAISAAVALQQASAPGGDSARRAGEVILRQSRHLSHIVDDLLDLSRMMSGKVALRRQTIDFGELVRRCVDTLAAAGTTAQHRIHVRTAPAQVDADPTRLEQVVSNLLVNACKYTPAGGRIDIDVKAEQGQALLQVRDSGVGIPAQLLPQVFDVFVQGPAQLDRAQGGLGIGLSLVRRLVELHGGSVGAESAGTGRGSCFTVRLPLAETVPSAPAPAAVLPESRPRVLLVEDNEDSRLTLAMVLQIYGHEVLEARDGPEGLRIALAQQPDVAVVDIGLPGLDGYEFARRLRAAPEGERIALVALTGYGQAEDRQRALDAGFDAHLVKPVEPARLLDVIRIVARA